MVVIIGESSVLSVKWHLILRVKHSATTCRENCFTDHFRVLNIVNIKSIAELSDYILFYNMLFFYWFTLHTILLASENTIL